MAELFDILSKAAVRLSAPDDQAIDDASWVVLNFDTVVLERGSITADPLTNTITVSKTGTYEIIAGINADFNAAEELVAVAFINGIQYSDNPIRIQGNGAGKPVSVFWISTVPLTAGDVVDIRMQNGDVGSVTVSIVRVSFSIKGDS